MPRRKRRDNDRLAKTQTQALNHPMRLRILEMHRRMRNRPLSVETLTMALSQTCEYRDVKQAEVKYHRDRLLDADLLPVDVQRPIPLVRLRTPTLYTFGEAELLDLDDRTAHVLRMRSGMLDGQLPRSTRPGTRSASPERG